MASQKQLDANRINALKSTGPRSESGKNKIRLNAKRDGITGQVITLSEEDRPVFEKLKAELIADLAPKTVMELRLASSIAWDTWRLDRLRAVEMNMYALGAQDEDVEIDCDAPEFHAAISGAVTFGKQSHQFALLSIYEQRLNRNIHKNLTTLRELQAERRRRYNGDLEQEVSIALGNNVNGLPYEAPARRSQNGFVFSTAEVLASANRQTMIEVAAATLRGYKGVMFPGAYEAYGDPGPNRPNSGPNSGKEFAAAA